MRRGEFGASPALRQLYRTIALHITHLESQSAPYLLHSVSIKNWTSNTAKKIKPVNVHVDGRDRTIVVEEWVDRAAELSANGQLAYDKKKMMGDLPGCMQDMLTREAVAVISGHNELTTLWKKEHKQWLKDKDAWEAGDEQKKYLAVKCHFDAFEELVGGKIRQRRGRWHKYLDFLRSLPQLAAWRGGEAKVNELDDAALKLIAKARLHKRRSVEAEEFWSRNPELRALDKLHGDYEKKFMRRGKPKRNPDGFKHPPTFTEPHPTLHPRWFVFNAPQTKPPGWRNLCIPGAASTTGSIDLQLLTGDKVDHAYPAAWSTIQFKADPRLCDFRPTLVKTITTKGKNKGQEKTKASFLFHDRQLKIARPANISGTKLIFKLGADGHPVAAFLVFTCDIDNQPLTEKAKETKNEFSEERNSKGKSKFLGRKTPDGLISLSVDIGIRHIGFASLARWNRDQLKVELIRARNIRIDSPESGSPDLAALAAHKKLLRRRRSQRGDPIRGEKSHVELQQHIDHMAEDRFKKAARAIINLALNASGDIDKKTGHPFPRADIVILENLANLLPDAEKERGINSSLIEFNRGQLVDRVKQVAEDVGLKLFEVSPVGTSQVCHRCGGLGRRYSIKREAESKGQRKRPVIHFGVTESLFACPKCPALGMKHANAPFTCNSDYNAAMNIQRRFYLGDSAVSAYPVGQANKAKRDAAYLVIDTALSQRLRKLHNLNSPEESVGDLPW